MSFHDTSNIKGNVLVNLKNSTPSWTDCPILCYAIPLGQGPSYDVTSGSKVHLMSSLPVVILLQSYWLNLVSISRSLWGSNFIARIVSMSHRVILVFTSCVSVLFPIISIGSSMFLTSQISYHFSNQLPICLTPFLICFCLG